MPTSFHEADVLVAGAAGALLLDAAGEIDELTDQNTLNNERITEMLDRLEIQRQNLLERYIAMETAIASANRIMDSLKQTTDQLANSNQ